MSASEWKDLGNRYIQTLAPRRGAPTPTHHLHENTSYERWRPWCTSSRCHLLYTLDPQVSTLRFDDLGLNYGPPRWGGRSARVHLFEVHSDLVGDWREVLWNMEEIRLLI